MFPAGLNVRQVYGAGLTPDNNSCSGVDFNPGLEADAAPAEINHPHCQETIDTGMSESDLEGTFTLQFRIFFMIGGHGLFLNHFYRFIDKTLRSA